MSEALHSTSALYIEPEMLGRMEHALSLEGPGVLRIPGALQEDFRQLLLTEIQDPHAVPWRDAGDVYVNNRGVEIVQNHDVFALKLSAGEQEPIDNVPCMRQLASETEAFIQSLGDRYESLGSWAADEMSYHRYYDADIGLSPHRDNMRFPGLIAVVSIDGECDFQVVDRAPIAFDEEGRVKEWHWRSTYTVPTKPGDIVLTRAPGLLPNMSPDDRPEHAVVHVRVLPRISFMLRANNKPYDAGYGFTYYNWRPEA